MLGEGGGRRVRERESLTILPGVITGLKVKRICMLSIQIFPAAWQTKSSIFCTALMLFREWGERTRCRGDEGEDEVVQVKGENSNR